MPADRFFHAAPEVLKTLKERAAENARELARNGIPKKPFYLTGQVEGKPFSVHREGDRVILHKAGEEREDIELKPSHPKDKLEVPAEEGLPPAVCPDGSPLSLWQHQSREDSPGTSPIDALAKVLEETKANNDVEQESREEEGGAQ